MGAPSSPQAVEQLKLSRELLTQTRLLNKNFQRNIQAILDNTEAVDGMHEAINGISGQLSGLKMDIVKETIEEGIPAQPDGDGS